MAITLGGGGKTPPQQQPKSAAELGQAAANAYARLQKKQGKRGSAAEMVGATLDAVVGDAPHDDEMAAAKKMLDEMGEDLPAGSGLAQAEAIAAKLAAKLDSSRGPSSRKVQAAFDRLDD